MSNVPKSRLLLEPDVFVLRCRVELAERNDEEFRWRERSSSIDWLDTNEEISRRSRRIDSAFVFDLFHLEMEKREGWTRMWKRKRIDLPKYSTHWLNVSWVSLFSLIRRSSLLGVTWRNSSNDRVSTFWNAVLSFCIDLRRITFKFCRMTNSFRAFSKPRLKSCTSVWIFSNDTGRKKRERTSSAKRTRQSVEDNVVFSPWKMNELKDKAQTHE